MAESDWSIAGWGNDADWHDVENGAALPTEQELEDSNLLVLHWGDDRYTTIHSDVGWEYDELEAIVDDMEGVDYGANT